MTPLAAESFWNDPRLAEAKRLALAALADHQKTLTGPRPADPERKIAYEQLLSHYGQVRAR